MARRILKINDSAWLFAESHRTPMQVGMLGTFAVPEDRPGFVAELVSRWREVQRFAPPYNYLLKMTPVPGWVELPDDQIDLDYHFRHSALPSPGSQRELGVLVSRLHSSMMDRRYPLWEVHVIEGLQPGRWSLYSKMHHSQVDGVGGIRMLKRMLSASADDREMLPPWAVGTRGPDQSGVTRPRRPKPERESISLLGAAGELVNAGRSVTTSLTKTYAESLTGFGEALRAKPFRAPKSIFNGRIHTPRRFATQQYSTDRLKRLGKAAEASLNDVFLAVIGGALRRYLIEHEALPAESLTANVPVSVRSGEGTGVGNAVSFLFATLGTDVEDPVERLQAVGASTQLGKARMPEAGGVAMDAYTALLMMPFLSQAIAGIGGTGPPAANVVVSNVPGPEEPRYIDGSLMEEFYPLSLLFNGQALNITAISYAGSFNIGFTGCRDSIPSLQRIAVYAGEELERLEEELGITAT